LVGAIEDREIAHGHQELSPKERPDAGQASEDLGLGALEKTGCYLLVQSGEALLEGEDLVGDFRDDAGGDLLGRQLDVLGPGGGEGLFGEGVGPIDATLLEVGGYPLMPRPADLRWALVTGEEEQGTFGVEVQGTLESGEKRQERLPETGYGAGLVDEEVASASEEELQLGEGVLPGSKLGEVSSHTGLIGDDAGVPLVGLGLSAVGGAGTVHGEAGDVVHPLPALPEQRQKQRRASTGLVDGPYEVLGEGERLVDERREAPLVVFDPAGEELGARGVEHMNPVELLSGVDADPGFVHGNLHLPWLAGTSILPSEAPPTAPYAASLGLRRSLLAVGTSSKGAEGRFPSSHRTAEERKPSSAPSGVIQELYPNDKHKDKEGSIQMMDRERTGKDLQGVFRVAQQSYQAAVENTFALQEKTLEFTRGLLEASVEDLRRHAEDNRAVFESLVEQSKNQREAMENLLRESLKVYESMLQSPFSHGHQHPEFEKAMEAPEVSPKG
jgi:hypothetical protein